MAGRARQTGSEGHVDGWGRNDSLVNYSHERQDEMLAGTGTGGICRCKRIHNKIKKVGTLVRLTCFCALPTAVYLCAMHTPRLYDFLHHKFVQKTYFFYIIVHAALMRTHALGKRVVPPTPHHTHTHMHAHTYTTHAPMHTRTHTCMHVQSHTHTHTHTRTHTHAGPASAERAAPPLTKAQGRWGAGQPSREGAWRPARRRDLG